MAGEHDELIRPGLPYRIAFDWLAYNLSTVTGPVAVLANTRFRSHELQKRLPGAPLWFPVSERERALAASSQSDSFRLTASETDRLAAIVALEPERESMSYLPELTRNVLPGSRCYAIVSGSLGRFLAEHRDHLSGLDLVDGRALVRGMRDNGWQITSRFGVHGLRAVFCHLMSTFATTVKRPDLQDRWHYAMRERFLETGLASNASALVCLSAEHKS